jgi:hypothetical protein
MLKLILLLKDHMLRFKFNTLTFDYDLALYHIMNLNQNVKKVFNQKLINVSKIFFY